METTEAIAKLRQDLQTVKGTGRRWVAIEALEAYLDGLEKGAAQSAESRRLEYQRLLAHYDAQIKTWIEMFKSVIDAGKEALNALLLINGGAVVALLGFLGANIAKEGSAALGMRLTSSLLLFGVGVLLGAVAFGVRYLSQAVYAVERNKIGSTLNVLTILIAIAGYIVFGFGVYGAYLAFGKHFAA